MDAKTVDRIAILARLDLDAAERDLFTRQLGAILEYVETLKELPAEGVEPLVHAIDTQNIFREDVPRPGLSADAALQNAPVREGDFFKVPRVK